MDPFDYRESLPGNAVQYLMHDHEWFRLMINTIRQSQSFDQRRLLVDKLLKVSCQHEEVEEEYFHPFYRKHVPNSEEIHKQILQKENEMKFLLSDLESNYANESEFNRLTELVLHGITEHMAQEETFEFPKVKEFASLDDLRKLEADMSRVRARAPTHAHPWAPSKPSTGNVLNQLQGLADQALDRMMGRPSTS